MGRLSENSVVSIKNKSFSVTAEVDVPDGGAEGVIIAQGGRFGGWAVYAKDGKAKFVYNVLGIHEFATEADAPIPAGTHQVRMEFAYDGGGLAKGGDVTLYYDGDRSRHGPRRSHPADDLLRRRDHRHRLRVRHHRHPRLHTPGPAGSPARSTGSRSTSATTTTTTSSTPRNASASPWPGNSHIGDAAVTSWRRRSAVLDARDCPRCPHRKSSEPAERTTPGISLTSPGTTPAELGTKHIFGVSEGGLVA